MEKNNKTIKRGIWIHLIITGILLIIVYKFLDNFTVIGDWIKNFIGILSPFLGAILISYILYTPCRKVEVLLKRKHPKRRTRVASIAIVYTITIILLVIIFAFIVPKIVNSIKDFVINLQDYYNQLNTNELDSIPWLENFAPKIKQNVIKPLVEIIQKIDFKQYLSVDRIQKYLTSAVSAVKVLMNIFVAIICSIYLMTERSAILKLLSRFIKSITKEENTYIKIRKYFINGSEIFFEFLTSQLIDAFVVAILSGTAMTILGIRYSYLLGLMLGISNLIPFFGAIIGTIVAVLIAILTTGWKQAIIMGIVVIILSQIDANIINPKITGKRLKISPLLIIFSVSIGGAYFGVIGMFLAVPIAATLKLIINDGVQERLDKKELNKLQNIKANDYNDKRC